MPTIPDLPTEPWEAMSIDYCGPFPLTKDGNNQVVGFICNLVQEAILLPCSKHITAKQMAKLFVKHVMPRIRGIPKKINCDRDPKFIANFWTELWKRLKTLVAFSVPYHTKSNSYIEIQNKTFQENLRSFINARQDDWDEWLTPFEFTYNSSFHPGLGDTPFFLSHGRHSRMPTLVSQSSPCPAVDDFVQTLQNQIITAQDHLRVQQGKRVDWEALKRKPVSINRGDLVLLSAAQYNLALPSRKLTPRWIGPLKVLQVRGPSMVIIEVPPQLSHIEQIQNVENLKLYVSRPRDI
jgi:hypothetical protein